MANYILSQEAKSDIKQIETFARTRRNNGAFSTNPFSIHALEYSHKLKKLAYLFLDHLYCTYELNSRP